LAATRENIFLLFIRARILMELFCVVDLSLSLEKTFTTSGFLTYSATMRLLAQLIFSLFSGFSVVCSLGKPASFLFPGSDPSLVSPPLSPPLSSSSRLGSLRTRVLLASRLNIPVSSNIV